MDQRVKALEDKVGDMRESIASIKATLEQMAGNLASKADVHELETTLIKWAVGTIIATSAVVFGIVRQAGPPVINVTTTPPVSAPAAPPNPTLPNPTK
jgi:hypothetical protein